MDRQIFRYQKSYSSTWFLTVLLFFYYFLILYIVLDFMVISFVFLNFYFYFLVKVKFLIYLRFCKSPKNTNTEFISNILPLKKG
jgi:hypothetical protein